MFWLILTIAAANFALGYALAVQLGWGSWPNLTRAGTSTGTAEPPESHGH